MKKKKTRSTYLSILTALHFQLPLSLIILEPCLTFLDTHLIGFVKNALVEKFQNHIKQVNTRKLSCFCTWPRTWLVTQMSVKNVNRVTSI